MAKKKTTNRSKSQPKKPEEVWVKSCLPQPVHFRLRMAAAEQGVSLDRVVADTLATHLPTYQVKK